MATKITIVITCYNTFNDTVNTIRSVLNNKLMFDIDIVTISYNNNKHLEQFLKTLSGKENIYIKHVNVNVNNLNINILSNFSQIMTEVLKFSKGDYITFIRDNSIWNDNKLLKQIKYMDDSDIYISCSNSSIVSNNSTSDTNLPLFTSNYSLQKALNIENVDEPFYIIENSIENYEIINLSTVMIQVKILKQNYPTFYEIIKHNSFMYINEPLVKTFIYKHNVTNMLK